MPFVDIQTELRHKRIGYGELGESNARNGKLADTYHTDSKLRESENTKSELADSNNSFGWHRNTICFASDGNGELPLLS